MTGPYFAAFCLRRAQPPAQASQPVQAPQPAQVGFTLPRAIGTAVVRNHIRRRLREAVALALPAAPENWAIVINPRRSALNAPFEELYREAIRIFERCSARS